MSSNAQKAHAAFQKKNGTEEGPGEWHDITQDQVNGFADATLDHQFIHVDPERAAVSTWLATARTLVASSAEALMRQVWDRHVARRERASSGG